MHLIYDKTMISAQTDGKYYFYSPANHVRIVTNEYSYFLISQILENNGEIDLEKIITNFANRFNVTLKVEDVMDQVERLVKLELFFYSEEDLLTSRTQTIERFKIVDKVPELVYLLLTYRCNFQCSYCYLRDTHKNIQELNTEQWLEAIRKLKNLGVKKFCVTGGEALVRDDIVDILQELKSDDCEVDLLTNGSLLAAKYEQVDPLIDHLVISLDSFDFETQSITRSSYGYQEILRAIELYSKKNPKKLKVRAVITKENLDQMNDFARKLNEEYGIHTIRSLVNPIHPDEIEMVPDVVGKLTMDDDMIDSLNCNMKYRKCGACHSVIALNPAGDILPCQAIMKPEFVMTNIFADKWFEKYLNSDVRKMFTSMNIDNIEKCNECAYRYLCGGCCPAMAYNIYGHLDSHVPFFCDFLKEKAQYTLTLAKGNWQDN